MSATLANLTPNTTYHYAIVATNAGGTAVSADRTFTTTTPPSAVTGSATDVTGSSATVSGTANPHGDPSTVYFQYGPTSYYGTSTPAQSAQGNTDLSFGAALTGLSTGTPYHFRLVAVNGPDIAYGADQTFTTLAPPGLGSASAQITADTQALIHATIDPSGQATQYYVKWGTDTGYGSGTTPITQLAQDVGIQSVQVPVGGLTAGTTYHAQLVAFNSAGTTYGPDQPFTTPMPPGVNPAPPAAITDASATLSGSITTNGFDTTYHFEYASASDYTAGSSYPHSTPPQPAADGVSASAQISQLTPGTVYHYRLVASNGIDTVASADQTFTTTTPPSAVTGSASGMSGSSAAVSGTANAHGDPSTVYFQYGPSIAYGYTTPVQNLSGTTDQRVEAILNGLATGTTYHYRLVAVNGPDTTRGADQIFTTLARPVLGAITSSPTADTAVTLGATINPSAQTTTYYFNYGPSSAYGSATASQTLASASSAQAVSASLSGLTAGTTYHAQLVAFNSAGTTYGPDQPFTTPMPPGVNPAPPAAITDASATLSGSITTNGFDTTYHFEYASASDYTAGSSYPHTTPPQPAADGVSASAQISQLTPGTALPLPAGGQQRNRHGRLRRRDLHDRAAAATAGRHDRGNERGRLDRDDRRPGEPARLSHQLPVPIRHEHQLRLDQHTAERRSGHRGDRRLRLAHRPGAGHHLLLPHAGHQQHRHHLRRHPDLHDDHATVGRDRVGQRRERQLGGGQRDRQRAR